MKGYGCLRIFNGSGNFVSEVIMTKRTLYIGRVPAGKSGSETSDPNVQYVLVPQECRGVSKLRHVKIYWRTDPSPSFVAEVVGRCNGACIRGAQHGEGGTALLPEDQISTISVGQSCYIFFSPAVRVFSTLKPQPSIDGDDPESLLPKSGTSAKRFPKLWSKAIMEVFTLVGANELTQATLVDQFKSIHAAAVSVYFGDSPLDLETELWSNLKRFVGKAPFEFDTATNIVKFDPLAVKAKAVGAKKQKLGSDAEEDSGMVLASIDEALPVE